MYTCFKKTFGLCRCFSPNMRNQYFSNLLKRYSNILIKFRMIFIFIHLICIHYTVHFYTLNSYKHKVLYNIRNLKKKRKFEDLKVLNRIKDINSEAISIIIF